MSSQQNRNRFFTSVVSGLGWPIFIGTAVWVGVYSLIHQGGFRNELVQRYLANHPVEYIETLMFCVGLAALAIKLGAVLQQLSTVGLVELAPAPSGGQKVDDCPSLLDSLGKLPRRLQNTYLVKRLREAIGYVRAKGSADELDDELKYLADLDADRRYEGYALVRLIVWAIPILGFLGTVIGVTIAISNLSPETLASPSQETMGQLTDGLAVAFDTTTVALSLSIVLMFAQFLVNRLETMLLETVDERVTAELVGRFEQWGTGADPLVSSVERMSSRLSESTEKLVRQQAQLWETTINAAHERWSHLSDASAKQLESTLGAALEKALGAHAAVLAQSERETSERSAKYIEQLRAALVQSAEVMKSQQSELVKQGQVMSRVLDATGQIMSLEKALNENLNTLAGAKNFEDTVMSLSAAIHLLNTRLGQVGGAPLPVRLKSTAPSQTQGRAA